MTIVVPASNAVRRVALDIIIGPSFISRPCGLGASSNKISCRGKQFYASFTIWHAKTILLHTQWANETELGSKRAKAKHAESRRQTISSAQ
jgi:hypothetical protein